MPSCPDGGRGGGAGASATSPGAAGTRAVIKDLVVQGNRRVQEAVILGRVSAKVGAPFQPSRLAEDVRAIFALGFFDDVQLKVEDFEGGVKVTFVVVERPFVRDIVFSGNKKLDTATLTEKIDLKLGSVYNPVEVNRAAEKLKEAYEQEGYFEVVVTPETEKLPDGDVTVIFKIAEGRKITIDRVVIEGAHGVPAKEIKAVMATQERDYYVLPGTVQRQKLDEDVERIVALYNDYGYIQARVESSDVQIDRANARAVIRIVVVEGPQFKVGGVDVTGTAVLPVEEIKRRIKLTPGDVFSRSKLRDSTKAITDLYSAIGRASADVTPEIVQDIPNRKVNITFEISEGPEVFVERINITGNTRSQEKILRREIPMAEGDLFTSQKLARARQRLVNLNYFETVNATTAPGPTKDKIIVNIDVVEKPTGLFSIGGGYSSQDSFIGTVDLSQRNFLGRGWEVFIRLRGGAQTQQGQIGFTEPWLFDRPLSAGFDLFNNRRVFTDYTVNSLGGDIRFGHPIGEYSRVNVIYRASQDTDQRRRPEREQQPARSRRASTTRRSSASPWPGTPATACSSRPAGRNSSVGVDFAGVGFGDQWFRLSGVARRTSHPTPWLDHVIGVRASAAPTRSDGATTPCPCSSGSSSAAPTPSAASRRSRSRPRIRAGRGSAAISSSSAISNTPFRSSSASGSPPSTTSATCGARTSADGLKFDITDLKQAIGLGVRWVSPFGPIRVDYGVNPNPKKPARQFGNFSFSVGSAF